MSSIEHCLPESARQHYIRLRNQKSEDARSSHRTKLADLRGEAAARGILRSGHQDLAEWKLAEEFIGKLAYGQFEAAVETCKLYEIPLDQQLCKCIENGSREFIVAQYHNALRHHASGVNGVKIPLSARNELSGRIQGCRFAVLNTIQIDLEKARVESQQRAKAKESRATAAAGSTGQKMFRTAIIINVLIASPSDVSEERDVVTTAVYAWNAANSSTTGIMLNPIRWETHSFPACGDRPQAIVNKQIVDEGQFLIGICGNRVGTPTGEAQSGTIEEIERFRKAGKHVALYFSTADVPRNADRDQLKALEEYQRERQNDALYFTFDTPEKLRQLVSDQLPLIVSEVFKGLQSSHELANCRPL